jgi:hypothetical protein
MTQKTVQPMYIMEVKDKKDWKEPKHSMKTPTPMVLTIAATVPAVFDMPARTPQIPSSFTQHRTCTSVTLTLNTNSQFTIAFPP